MRTETVPAEVQAIANQHASKMGYIINGEHAAMIARAILQDRTARPAITAGTDAGALSPDDTPEDILRKTANIPMNSPDYYRLHDARLYAQQAIRRAERAAITPETAEAVPVAARPGDAARQAALNARAVLRAASERGSLAPTAESYPTGGDVLNALEQLDAALASAPAPAGDAVEPAGYQLHLGNLGWSRMLYQEDETNAFLANPNVSVSSARPLYAHAAHPDPELTRLREENKALTVEVNELAAQSINDVMELRRTRRELDDARRENRTARESMRDVITQADCLRHYARMEDSREHKILPTVGEIQAGHFEDIATRAFPDLEPYLEEKRAARASTAGSPTDGE